MPLSQKQQAEWNEEKAIFGNRYTGGKLSLAFLFCLLPFPFEFVCVCEGGCCNIVYEFQLHVMDLMLVKREEVFQGQAGSRPHGSAGALLGLWLQAYDHCLGRTDRSFNIRHGGDSLFWIHKDTLQWFFFSFFFLSRGV